MIRMNPDAGAGIARIVLRILTLIIRPPEHGSGPFAMLFGQQIRISAALRWWPEADPLRRAHGQPRWNRAHRLLLLGLDYVYLDAR